MIEVEGEQWPEHRERCLTLGVHRPCELQVDLLFGQLVERQDGPGAQQLRDRPVHVLQAAPRAALEADRELCAPLGVGLVAQQVAKLDLLGALDGDAVAVRAPELEALEERIPLAQRPDGLGDPRQQARVLAVPPPLALAADGVGKSAHHSQEVDAPRQLLVGVDAVEQPAAGAARLEQLPRGGEEALADATHKGGHLPQQLGALFEGRRHASVLRH